MLSPALGAVLDSFPLVVGRWKLHLFCCQVFGLLLFAHKPDWAVSVVRADGCCWRVAVVAGRGHRNPSSSVLWTETWPGLSELFGKDNPFLNIMTRLVYTSPRRWEAPVPSRLIWSHGCASCFSSTLLSHSASPQLPTWDREEGMEVLD